jgi:hypothetical protein
MTCNLKDVWIERVERMVTVIKYQARGRICLIRLLNRHDYVLYTHDRSSGGNDGESEHSGHEYDQACHGNEWGVFGIPFPKIILVCPILSCYVLYFSEYVHCLMEKEQPKDQSFKLKFPILLIAQRLRN